MHSIVIKIHQWLDAPVRAHIETNVYERYAVWGREIVLLGATLTAALSFADLRSWIPALSGAAATAIQTEARRAKASVGGRHAEAGHVAAPLPPKKQAILDAIATRERFFLWFWPLFGALLSASYARSITAALVVALVSGYVRAAWETRWFPAWRKSRVSWKRARPVLARIAPYGGPWEDA